MMVQNILVSAYFDSCLVNKGLCYKCNSIFTTLA